MTLEASDEPRFGEKVIHDTWNLTEFRVPVASGVVRPLTDEGNPASVVERARVGTCTV